MFAFSHETLFQKEENLWIGLLGLGPLMREMAAFSLLHPIIPKLERRLKQQRLSVIY